MKVQMNTAPNGPEGGIMTKDSYVLFWDVLTSAIVPHVMLLEMDVPFELVHIDTAANEHKQAEYLSINPNGLMPALRLPDGTTLGETAAILLVLGDRHPETGLVPRLKDQDRPMFLHWLSALATTGHTTMRRHCYPDQYTSRQDALDGISEVSFEQLDYFFGVVETAIDGDPFFLQRGFGPLDMYLTFLLKFYDGRDELFERRPKIASIYASTLMRASFQEVLALHFDR